MEHINIITQEEITTYTQWPMYIIAFIAIVFCIIGLCFTSKDIQKSFNWFYYATACIPLMILALTICSIFLQHPTGRYEYTATLDPEMTLVEFEEFKQAYDDIYYKDGIWHFKDKEIK